VKDALGFYEGIIEELKADLLSAYNLPYLVEKGVYSDIEAREIYTEECLWRNIPFNRPKEKDTHYLGALMKLNYYLADSCVKFINGMFSLDFGKAAETTRKMVEEVLSIQSEGSRERAKAFIERWSAWTPEADYAAKVMQECGAKIYKEVIQKTAEDLLGE
jgi:hypothetical protein